MIYLYITIQHIISVIDNMIKGAAGQAIQNMNVMCGFKESEGLEYIGPSF